MLEEIKEQIAGISEGLIDKKRKEMLEIRKRALGCAIQQELELNGNKYLITVNGADPDLVLRGFEEFREKCLKKLK